MQYVVYKRVSTKKQGDSGLGLEAQDRDISLFLSSYAQAPEVVGVYVDVLSGSSGDRPELAKAIAHAKDCGATLLVSKLDRLSRKVSFIAQVMEDKNLKLQVAQMPHADKFQLHIYAALAEQERDFISMRTKAALREAKARGVMLGGLRPGTAERNAAMKAQADRRAEHVWQTVRDRREAGATLQSIADELNHLGIETARGGKWYPSTVKGVIDRMAQSQ